VNKDKEKSLKRTIGIDLPQRRFGLIAIEKGFIKADHLYEALMRQGAQETGGAERRPLGMIFKDLGYRSIKAYGFVRRACRAQEKFAQELILNHCKNVKGGVS